MHRVNLSRRLSSAHLFIQATGDEIANVNFYAVRPEAADATRIG